MGTAVKYPEVKVTRLSSLANMNAKFAVAVLSGLNDLGYIEFIQDGKQRKVRITNEGKAWLRRVQALKLQVESILK